MASQAPITHCRSPLLSQGLGREPRATGTPEPYSQDQPLPWRRHTSSAPHGDRGGILAGTSQWGGEQQPASRGPSNASPPQHFEWHLGALGSRCWSRSQGDTVCALPTSASIATFWTPVASEGQVWKAHPGPCLAGMLAGMHAGARHWAKHPHLLSPPPSL